MKFLNGIQVDNLNSDLLDGHDGSYYAPIDSPSFTGTPTASTPVTSDSSTKIATTAWVKSQGYGTGGGSGVNITISSTAPSSPNAGDIWYQVK